MPARTLDELAQLLEQSAGESARTNELLNQEVMPRLDRLDATVKEAGLNGHTSLLKKFLDEYAAGQSKQQAWAVVRADVGGRFRFLASPKGWLKTFLTGLAGALAWETVSSISHLQWPFHLPFH